MYNALLFSRRSPTSFNKLLTSPDSAFEKSSRLYGSATAYRLQGFISLSSQVEPDLLSGSVLRGLLSALVLVRILLHDFGCQLPEECCLSIAGCSA